MKKLILPSSAYIMICVLLGGFLIPLDGCKQAQSDPATAYSIVTWTATGDDGDVGQASWYDLRWALDSMQLKTDWGGCRMVDNEPWPKSSGSPESLRVENLPVDTILYFRIVVADEAMNWGEFSNIAIKRTYDETPPGRISDLEAN